MFKPVINLDSFTRQGATPLIQAAAMEEFTLQAGCLGYTVRLGRRVRFVLWCTAVLREPQDLVVCCIAGTEVEAILFAVKCLLLSLQESWWSRGNTVKQLQSWNSMFR